MILVSACLVGRPTRYDGRTAVNRELLELLSGRDWAAVCPEQLGGLGTPRPPADMEGGTGSDVLRGAARVIDRNGRDVTDAFLSGAESVLDIARRFRVERCYLKDRSPSCAVTSFTDKKGRPRGRGVCAAILTEAGFEVIEMTAERVENNVY